MPISCPFSPVKVTFFLIITDVDLKAVLSKVQGSGMGAGVALAADATPDVMRQAQLLHDNIDLVIIRAGAQSESLRNALQKANILKLLSEVSFISLYCCEG